MSLKAAAIAAFLVVVFSFELLLAENRPALLPPARESIYSKDPSKLNASERWQVMIHGLRMAPLDPRVWGIRSSERTANRRLVPMRPYILRASATPRFFFEEIDITISSTTTTVDSCSAGRSPPHGTGSLPARRGRHNQPAQDWSTGRTFHWMYTRPPGPAQPTGAGNDAARGAPRGRQAGRRLSLT